MRFLGGNQGEMGTRNTSKKRLKNRQKVRGFFPGTVVPFSFPSFAAVAIPISPFNLFWISVVLSSVSTAGTTYSATRGELLLSSPAAMIPVESDTYELAKMTVDAEYRGSGIANKLMDQCILFAKEKEAKEIILITNDTLVIARNLYDKYGFKEVTLDSDKYLRGNVKMTLNLTEE